MGVQETFESVFACDLEKLDQVLNIVFVVDASVWISKVGKEEGRCAVSREKLVLRCCLSSQ